MGLPVKSFKQIQLTGLFISASLLLGIAACSMGKPPDDLFHDDVEKMVLLDRELGFREEISRIMILERKRSDDRVEVVLQVNGWAAHPDLKVGATLPAGKEAQESWAVWKYYCRKTDGEWKIEEKYKVDEGH